MSTVEDIIKPSEQSNNTQIDSNSNVQDGAQLAVKSFFHTWTVNNFSECFNFSIAEIHSPEFTFEGANWRLLLQTTSKNDELDEIKIRLLKCQKGGPGYYIKYKFSLINSDGSLVTKDAASCFLGESVWGHRLSFRFNKRINEKLSSVVKNDGLSVLCELLVLSSSVDCDNPVSVPNATNDSKNEVTESDSDIPKAETHKPLSAHTRIFTSRKKKAMERSYFVHTREDLFVIQLFCLMCIYLLINYLMQICSTDEPPLNIREVNELIIDSTIKIKNIAEALNLTDVKAKSSELLALYHKIYDISDLNYSKVRVNFSEPIFSNYKLNTVSGLELRVSGMANNSYKFDNQRCFITPFSPGLKISTNQVNG